MINKLIEKIERYGVLKTIYYSFFITINKLFTLKIYRCMLLTRETLDEKYLKIEEDYTCRFIDIDDSLYKFKDKLQLSDEFLNIAKSKNDLCYAIFNNKEFASYGWYSINTTDIGDELSVKFNNKYVYQYNGFTFPDYRGKRLHAIGMAKALDALTIKGFHGLVAIVESVNFNSLKSVYRMGFHDFGKIIVYKIGKKYYFFPVGNCNKYDFVIFQSNFHGN